MSKNTLLINSQTVKSRTGLHANVDEGLLLPEIRVAQDLYLTDALGSGLMERLQAAIVGGVGVAALTTEETTLLNDYIADCLANYTMAEFVVSVNYQTYNKATLTKSDGSAQAASTSSLLLMRDQYRERAEYYKTRMIAWLRLSANQAAFPTYYTYTTGGIAPSTTSYTTSVWLGSDNDRDCCC